MKKNLSAFLTVAATVTLLLTSVSGVEAKSYSSPSRSSSSSSSSSFKSSPSKSSTSSYKNNSYTDKKTQTGFSTTNNASTPTKNVTATYKSLPSKSVITNKKPADAIVSKDTYKVPNPKNLPTETRYETRYDPSGKVYSVRIDAPIGYNLPIVVPHSYYPASATTPVVVYGDVDNSVGSVVWNIIGGVIILIVIVAVFKGN